MIITDDHYLNIHSFATDTALLHQERRLDNPRELDKVHFDIVTGKMAEAAFWSTYLGDSASYWKMLDTSRGPDDGWDFEVNSIRVDVKSSAMRNPRRMYYNPSYIRADIYVFYSVSHETRSTEFGGWFFAKELLDGNNMNRSYTELWNANTSVTSLSEYLNVSV